MENMERKLSEMEIKLKEMDDLTQESAKLIKVLADGVLRNSQSISETNDRLLSFAKLILSEKEQVNTILQHATEHDTVESDQEGKPAPKETGVTWGEFAQSIFGEQKVTEPETKKYLVWGKMSFHPRSNRPILELKTKLGKDGEEEIFGYVSPFRGILFHVSKSYDGELDMASYYVQYGVMAKAIRECNKPLKCEIYKGMLYTTISKLLSNGYGKDLHPSYRMMRENDSPVKEFIDASIEWVETLKL